MRRHIAALAAAVTGLAATANGYRPAVRNGWASIPAFFLGVMVTELPLHATGSQLGLVTLLSRRLPRRLRWATWAISALSSMGLIGLDRIARSADATFDDALDAGLGGQRVRGSTAVWRRPPARPARAKGPGLIRMMRIHRDYAHDSDIPYGPHGKANLLDIWSVPNLRRDGRAPVLLQVPGGAWAVGNKHGQAHPLMSHLAELGWVCVSINYRQSPRHTWPDHIVDVKRAIAWVKDNIDGFGGDPSFVAITGGSAGGHLSALAALTPNDPEWQPDFSDADTTVQAAVPLYGVYDFSRTDGALHSGMVPHLESKVMKLSRAEHPDLFRAASPIAHVGPHAPPFFVVHGRNDCFIPVEQAKSFVSRLRDVSLQPVVYAELPRTQHSFDTFGSPRAMRAAAAVEQFLAQIYCDRVSKT
jgi:acetyl esterase/lipase